MREGSENPLLREKIHRSVFKKYLAKSNLYNIL